MGPSDMMPPLRSATGPWTKRVLRARALALLVSLPCLAVPGPAGAAMVNSVKAGQEGNRFLFEYTLSGAEPEANVVLRLTIHGKVYGARDLHLAGDVGKVRTGRGRKIVWEVLKDFPEGLSGEVSWELVALGRSFADPTTGMEFVLVTGGCFRVDPSAGGEDQAGSRQAPREECVPDYYMGKFEVTQGEWGKVMGDNPSRFRKGPRHPAEQVSWRDADTFIGKLGRLSGERYRLPTEAEWEYAARGGGGSARWSGTSNKAALGEYAWYRENSSGSTHPVGQTKANGIGLHDMSGNVWEWCSEAGEGAGDNRKPIRGGSWYNDPGALLVSARYREKTDERIDTVGFRLVRSVGE